jgi:hypothetical protein
VRLEGLGKLKKIHLIGIVFLNNNNKLVFLTEMRCALCVVRTEFLNDIQMNLKFQRGCYIRTITASVQLENKNSGRESQEACRQDELISGNPPVVK